MSDDSKASGLKGFIVGALVAGTVAAGLLLSKTPEQPPLGPGPAPLAMPSPGFAPAPAAPRAPASPLEAADLLFNEAMMASEQNDQATLSRTLPGAIAAYRSLGQLSDDSTYHLALLELAGGKLAEARATCATILAKNPNHLLALGVTVRAAVKGNDTTGARDFGQRLLKAYDSEVGRPLPEYQDHDRLLPVFRAEAMATLK